MKQASASGSRSQWCRRLSQVACDGAWNSGSAKAPTATAIIDGRRSGSHQTVDPHVAQKWKAIVAPLSETRLNRVDVPRSTVTCALPKKAAMPNAEPVRR